MSLNERRPRRSLIRLALLLAALAAGAGGCARDRADITGSIPAPRTESALRQRIEAYGKQYKAHPNDPRIAVAYAQALRAGDQHAQAAAVLQQASIRHPKDKAVLGAYGRALADTGRLAQALEVLSHAHTPDRPDWRILNAQGTVLDQMGRHREARRYYDTALKIAPNQPSILSNLGLSYALSKQLKRAETNLRLAAEQPGAGPKVRENLTLVLGLRGKFAEAEKIAAGHLPPEQARANVAQLRKMMAQRNPWKQLGARKTAASG